MDENAEAKPGCFSAERRHNTVRWINIIMAGALLAFGIFSLISLYLNPLNYLFAIYYLFFGLILFMSFFKFKWIEANFLFLQTPLGKGLFDIFISSMLFVNLDETWNIVLGSFFGAVGIILVCLSCCCKKPEDADGAD
mmetsp:Transcript_18284/g.13130  ORF Transcript_18284/g.13130 Transcript_18284/m.13130 type:complete len:138 (-) Transcript_18284:272-685(-)